MINKYKYLYVPILLPLNFYQIIANINPPLPFQPHATEHKIPINPSKHAILSLVSWL